MALSEVITWEKDSNSVIMFEAIFASFWGSEFEKVYGKDKSHIWDYQWTFSCLIQNCLSINPCVNLVSNIGYGEGATHTMADVTDPRSNLPAEEIAFPLLHPPFIIRDAIADEFIQRSIFTPSRIIRAKGKLHRFFKRLHL